MRLIPLLLAALASPVARYIAVPTVVVVRGAVRATATLATRASPVTCAILAAPASSAAAPVRRIAATTASRRTVALAMHAGAPLVLREQELAAGVVLAVVSFVDDLEPADKLFDGQGFQVHQALNRPA